MSLASRTAPLLRLRAVLAILAPAAMTLASCSDTVAVTPVIEAGAAVCADAGARTDAAPDDHCRTAEGASIAQPVTTCAAEPSDDAGPDDTDPPVEEEVAPHEGTEADDDDCKYHVKLTADCLSRDRDVTLMMTATTLSDATQVTGDLANMYIEASLDGLPPPNTTRMPSESNGVYSFPIRFDRSGRWTVRVHLFGECSDLVETSKHAHVGFFVDVP